MEPTLAEEASAEAVHKAGGVAQAVEAARQLQIAEALKEGAASTRAMLLDVISQVFGDSDSADPGQMKILVRRVPILCTQIDQIHVDISWIKKITTGAIFLLVPIFGWLALTTINNTTQLAGVAASVKILINQK